MDGKVVLFLSWAILFCILPVIRADGPEPTVWIDADPQAKLYFGSIVTVRYTGYMNYSKCQVQLVDADNRTILYTHLNTACRANFTRFQLFPMLDVFNVVVYASCYIDYAFSNYAVNETAYSVGFNPARSILSEYKPEIPEYLKPRTEDYYYEYYRPAGAEIWVYGDPTILGPFFDLDVYFTGVEQYNKIKIELWTDDGGLLSVYGKGFDNYAAFTKQELPDSPTAWFNLIVYDNDTGDDLFCFTSWDSYQLFQDPYFEDNRRQVARAIEEHVTNYHSQGRSVHYVDPYHERFMIAMRSWLEYRSEYPDNPERRRTVF